MSVEDRCPRKGEDFIIGKHMGPYSLVYRLIFAVFFLVFFIISPLVLDPQPLDKFWLFLGETALWLMVIAAIYFVVFYALMDRILGVITPWAGTAIFLGTPMVLGFAGVLPTEVWVAFGVYDALSLLLAIKMRYAGCEVVALPSFIFGKRYTMYCGLNAFDIMERGLVYAKGEKSHPILNMISLTITVFLISYFLFIQPRASWVGIEIPIDQKWVYLLLIPMLHLTWNSWVAFRQGGIKNKYVRWFGFGAIIILFNILVTDGLINFADFWNGAKILGAIYALYEGINLLRRRKKLRKA